ncbi:hypothetical protein Tco_0429118 [Tanacetum coccineum]
MTLVRDPSPTAAEFSAEACYFLTTHPALFRRFPEPFLCLVGLSRYYELDDNVYPTFLTDAGEGGHADPTKVRIGERQIEEGQVLLLESTKGGVIPLAGGNKQGDQNDNVEDVGPHDLNKEGGGAEVGDQTEESDCVEDVQAAVADKPRGTRRKRKASGGASGSNLPPKKLREDHGTSGDASAKYRWEVPCRASRSPIPPTPVMTAAIATTAVAGTSSAPVLGAEMHSETLQHIYVPKWNVINDFALDDPEVGHSMIDQLAPPRFFSQLRGMDYDQLFAEFNVGTAHQMCLTAKVRQADLLKEKDAQIANLKAQLSLKEAEVEEAICLRSQVFIVEDAKATRISELDSLKERNLALEGEKSTLEGQVMTLESAATSKSASLESKRDGLVDQVLSLEGTCSSLRDQVSGYELFKEQCDAVQVKVLSDRVAELDSELMGMVVHLDEEFYPRLLSTIAGRRWVIGHGLRLEVMKCLQSAEYATALGTATGIAIDKGMQTGLVAGIDHKKAKRSLADVAAYDPSMEAKYVSAVLAFQGPFAKTPEETSLSDSLEAVHARFMKIKEGASSHRLSFSDAMGPLVDPLSSKNLVGEASTSGVPSTVAATTALVVANVNSVVPIFVTDYGVLDAEPQFEASHSPKVVFEKEDLDTLPDYPSTI